MLDFLGPVAPLLCVARKDVTTMDARNEVYLVADELRALASLGIHYADNHYDQHRYE